MIHPGQMDGIVSRAATLFERYGPQLALGTIPEAMPMDVLMTWDRTLTDRYGSHLVTRLRLYPAAADANMDSNGGAGHHWNAVFEKILTPGAWNMEYMYPSVIDTKHPVPFEELLAPFVNYVAIELEESSHFREILTQEAHTEHLRNLLRKLSYVSSRCFYQVFDAFRRKEGRPGYARFTQTWLTGGYVAFFAEYAALARIMTTVCTQWISATRTFLSRLSADSATLAAHFNQGLETGPLVRIASGVAAMHSDDGEVYRLTFASGLRLLYKPRSAETDIALAQILDWLNTSGDLIPMRAVPVLNREDYSWHGYISHRKCGTIGEVRNYYQRIGQLAGLLQVLGSTDYHFDNLRADGAHPYLVDHETVFSPLLRISPDHTYTGDAILDTGLLNSIARSLFLSDTRQMFFPRAQGISGVFARSDTYLWTRYRHVNTDQMRERQGSLQHTGKNIPRIGQGTIRPEDYIDEIQKGYVAALRHILHRKGDFVDAVYRATGEFSIQVRLLIRPTAAYEQIMHASLAPGYLRDGQTRSLLFERLVLLYVRSPATREAARYLRRELDMLEQFLVPAFSASANAVDTAEVSCISLQAKAVFDQNVRALSDAFVQAQQNFLCKQFEHRRPDSGERTPAVSWPAKDVLKLCAQFIRVYAQFYPIEQVLAAPEQIRGAYYLDNGLAGVLLLHSSLQKVAPEYAAFSSTEHILELLLQYCQIGDGHNVHNPYIGLVKGSGSVVWLLTLLFEISGDTGYLELAKALALRITDIMPDHKDLSYATGSAGLLLSLLRLGDHCSDPATRDVMDRLSVPLIRTCMEPAVEEARGLLGGTEGALFALCALYRQYPDPALKQRIVSTHLRLEADWRAQHNSNKRVPAALSLKSGLAGWHLTDAAVHLAFKTNPRPVVIQRLNVLTSLTKHDTDTITHGIAGRAECALLSGDDTLRLRLLTDWVKRNQRIGFCQLHPYYLHPGFFSGISGILYQQLRLLFPGALPSALGLF